MKREYIAQLIFAAWNVATAIFQGVWINNHMATGPDLLHWPWTLAAAAIGSALAIWATGLRIGVALLLLALVAGRMIVFNPVINYVRGIGFFYFNDVNKSGSLEWIETPATYVVTYFACLVFVAIYNTIIVKHERQS